MNKSLTVILAASVLVVMTVTLITMVTSGLSDTGDSSDQLQDNTACSVQAREAERADNPEMVEDDCLDYIEDPVFQSDAESAEVECILSGTC